MRRVTVAKLKRRKRIRVLVISFLCFCSFWFLVFWSAGQLDGFSVWLVEVAGVTILGCLLLMAVAKVRKWTESEYRDRERHFEETGSQSILDTFGTEALRKLYHDEQNAIFPARAIDICREMLQSKESGDSAHLRFHLLVRLARYYVKDGQPPKSDRVSSWCPCHRYDQPHTQLQGGDPVREDGQRRRSHGSLRTCHEGQGCIAATEESDGRANRPYQDLWTAGERPVRRQRNSMDVGIVAIEP